MSKALTWRQDSEFRTRAHCSAEEIGETHPFAIEVLWPQAQVLEGRVRKALDFMAARLSHPICLSDIAAHAGVSHSRLQRAFRREIGLTPMRALRIIRFQKAAALMGATQKSLKEIALESGLADRDLSHFRRDFALLVGSPPARYRKLARSSPIPCVTNLNTPSNKLDSSSRL
jgi:transcriptional regulator GlxA family with amidase domain